MHDKANKPIGAVCANAFAYAALTLFYIANFVTNDENHRNLKFVLQFAKIIPIYLPIRLNPRSGHQTGSGEPSAGG